MNNHMFIDKACSFVKEKYIARMAELGGKLHVRTGMLFISLPSCLEQKNIYWEMTQTLSSNRQNKQNVKDAELMS